MKSRPFEQLFSVGTGFCMGFLKSSKTDHNPFLFKNCKYKAKAAQIKRFKRLMLELLGRFELPTSSLPTAVEPSSPCCTRLCGGFLSKKDEVAACLFHCFRPLISPCGSRCGSELLQDMSKGHTFGNGNPPILLIASKWLKLHGTYSVSKYTTSLAENEARIYNPPHS